MVEKGAISKEEYQVAEANVRISKATLDTTVRELEKGKTGSRKEDIVAIEARVRHVKENVRHQEHQLEDTKMLSPFTARVVDKLVENFEDINAKQPIVTLQQIDNLKLNFSLPEGIVFNLERGNIGEFTAMFDGLPGKEFPVKFNEFQLEADAKTRTFTCWALLPPPPGALVLPGMSGEIIHRLPKAAPPGFLVPAGSLFSDDHSLLRLESRSQGIDRS